MCAAGKPENSRIGNLELRRLLVSWVWGAGCWEVGSWEKGARNQGLGSEVRSGEKVVGSSDIPTLCETGLGEKT